MSADDDENESGLVRSKRVPPAVKMPGNWAALVPLVNVPLDPKSASEPFRFASRPHCSAAFGSDLSSQRSTAMGRPSAHWLLTALSAAAVASFVSVEILGTESGPVRLRMAVNWRGLALQDAITPRGLRLCRQRAARFRTQTGGRTGNGDKGPEDEHRQRQMPK